MKGGGIYLENVDTVNTYDTFFKQSIIEKNEAS